jgi:hypothetical protein
MERCRIVCSLAGQESEAQMYGEYKDLAQGTFPTDRHARLVQRDLIARARAMRWELGPPSYEIVPAAE